MAKVQLLSLHGMLTLFGMKPVRKTDANNMKDDNLRFPAETKQTNPQGLFYKKTFDNYFKKNNAK